MCSLGGGDVPFWGVEMCQFWGVEMCWDEVNYSPLAQRVDLVDMCPTFDFVLKRLDIHTLDSKLRYMITIIIVS